jgi:type I restriction enzyme S subunit
MGREHLREGWHYGKLGDFITLQRGFDLPEYKRLPGKIPVVTSSGITGTHSHSKASGPGVVMGRYGTIGQLFFIKENFWPHNTSLYVRDFKGNDPRFIFYFLKTMNYQSHNDKSSVPGLNRNHLHLADAIIPPLPIQRRIAHILGTLDDKIEQSRRMNATLEAIARALFRSWFVDFDPVRAKADGRDPPGMDTATAALFPAAFEDSPLGKVPRGWRVGTVGDDFNLTMGQSPPGHTYNQIGDGVSFFQGRTDFGFRFPTPRVYCTEPTRFAHPGDTLVSVRAPVGDINMANERCCVGRGVGAIRHKSDSRSYTYYFMLSIKGELERFEAEGTVFGSINKRDFQNIDCIIPPTEIVQRFEKLVSPLDQSIENRTTHTRTLAALRDTLLPKLLSGEVGVGGESA